MSKFRFLTAGESHGKCLTAIIEGIPAGFEINPKLINEDLKRRQSGYGRGTRMQIESDTVEITSGIRFGKTLGSPITLVVQNKDYKNWEKIMSINPKDYTDEKSFTQCRPGHADYAGSIKYNHKDLRNILERSSARKTAIEVAVGSVAKQILAQFGIKCSSKILQIGRVKGLMAEGQESVLEGKKVRGLEDKPLSEEQRTGGQEDKLLTVENGKLKVESLSSHAPSPDGEGRDGVIFVKNNNIPQQPQTDNNSSTFQPFNLSTKNHPTLNLPIRGGNATDTDLSPNNTNNSSFNSEIDRVKALGNTIGGKFEIVFENLPIGLGSYVHWDRMLDGKIAQAVMSIPAVKVLEIGENPLGFLGSEYHDEMYIENGKIVRKTNNAGGIEGGMTNGEPLVVKAVMKPIPTMKKPLKTVDLVSMTECEAHFERSDTCAVEACSVIAEARIACVLADELLQKFGGDSLDEILKHT